MTIQIGDSGKATQGTLKKFDITMPTPRETSLGVITLPITEGSTNQVSYTVQTGDLPVITPTQISFKYLATLYVAGKTVTAATISYKIFKNGAMVTSGTNAVAANTFYTFSHFRYFDVVVGDVLEVRTWSNQVDSNIDYGAIKIFPASIYLAPPNVILKDFVTGAQQAHGFTGAGVRTAIIGNTGVYVIAVATNAGITTVATVGGNIQIPAFLPNPTVAQIRMAYGDFNPTSTAQLNHATGINIQQNQVPVSVSYREMLR